MTGGNTEAECWSDCQERAIKVTKKIQDRRRGAGSDIKKKGGRMMMMVEGKSFVWKYDGAMCG